MHVWHEVQVRGPRPSPSSVPAPPSHGDTRTSRLDGEEWLIENPESRRLILKPADGAKTLREARRVQLCGHGYEDNAAAEREGRYWRHRLTLLFMSTGIGADFGDRAAFALAMRPALDRATADAGAPVMNDVHGLMTFPTSPSPIMMRVGPVTVTVSPSRERFVETEWNLAESRVILPEASTVAYDLFSASFSAAIPDARFMLLMMALETLLTPPARSDEAQALVRSLIASTEASGLPEGEIKSIVGSLQWLLRESISRTGRALAKRLGDERYQDETPSKLLH